MGSWVYGDENSGFITAEILLEDIYHTQRERGNDCLVWHLTMHYSYLLIPKLNTGWQLKFFDELQQKKKEDKKKQKNQDRQTWWKQRQHLKGNKISVGFCVGL